MKTAPRLSGPVLAFGIVGLIFSLLVSWYGYQRQQPPPPSIAPATTAPAAEANVAPADLPPPDAVIPRTFAGELPPVIPISLGAVIPETDNALWLNDPLWLTQPRGTQILAGVEFHIAGAVQLQGAASVRYNENYRTNVFIPLTAANLVGEPALVSQLRRHLGALHVLGAVHHGSDSPGRRLADVIWHYEDGSSRRTPVQYDVHVRDWWRTRYEDPERLPYVGTKVVWRGENQSVPNRSLRLYRVSLQNPEPDKRLAALEWVSAMANPTLFFVALTLDPLNVGERPDGTPDLEETDPPPAGQTDVFVQTADGQPLAGAQVRAIYTQKNGDQTSRDNKTLTTDANGQVRFRFAIAMPTQLDLQVAAPDDSDYVARKISWDTTTGDVIPAAHTFKLGPGISLGGTVVDDAGSAIADAKVALGRFWIGGDDMNKKGEQVDFPSRTQTTDANGAWLAKGLSPELLDRIRLNVSHPDFVGTNLTVGNNAAEEAALRNGTHRLVLPRGLIVRGRVIDESDNPIPDARVWAGMVNYGGTLDTKTDVNGAFRFRNQTEGEKQFSVLAKGRKPEVRKVVVKADMAEIVFRLGPGNVIRGIVKNEGGEVIAGVRVALESSTGGVSHEYQFEMTTDAEGRFEWTGAPEEPKNFCFLKEGYEAKRRQTLKPAEENVITLRKGRKVQAWVVDAETEKPVTKFRAAAGRRHDYGDSENFYADWPGMKDYANANGTFTVDLNEEEVNAVKAEADDYAGKVEKLPAAENGVVSVTLRLKPSASVRGVLVNAQGQAVPGATVALTRESSAGGATIQLRKGRLTSFNRDTKIAITDAEGKFTLNSPPETGGLVVAAADSGFARASVDEVRATGRLVLQDFGRVEGSIKIAGSPSAGQEFMFSLMNIGVSPDWESYRTKSDADGKFAFEKLPPGEGQVVRLIKTTPNSWAHSHNTPVSVEPGKTVRVSFGEEGAVIQGHVRWEVPPGEGAALTFGGFLNTKTPAFQDFATPEEASAFFQSEEWKQQMKQMKHYGVAVNADGTFSLDSIPPGEYTLSISANKPGAEPWQHVPVATGSMTVTVPDSASPYAPIGLSDIILRPVKK